MFKYSCTNIYDKNHPGRPTFVTYGSESWQKNSKKPSFHKYSFIISQLFQLSYLSKKKGELAQQLFDNDV